MLGHQQQSLGRAPKGFQKAKKRKNPYPLHSPPLQVTVPPPPFTTPKTLFFFFVDITKKGSSHSLLRFQFFFFEPKGGF